eukprot:Em0017g914a
MCSGTVANRNKLWFTELSDKMKSTKTHLYWCMKNCTGNADDLHVMIMNISRHYQCCSGDEEEEGSNDDGFFVPGLEDGDFVDDDDDDNDDADDIVEDEM